MDLEQTLGVAKARMARAVEALAPAHVGGEWEEYLAAADALHIAERALAAARDEEHAVPLDFPVTWNTGAPMPHLLVNDHRAFLIFLANQPSPAGEMRDLLALVEFHGCQSAKLGAPNDEVFEGHPLAGKGLEGYEPQVVRNSRWIAELRQINSVHSLYRPESWQDCIHYIFWFHDSTFECIAESFTVELHGGSTSEVLAEACRRLLE